ncbi:hypothetical protein IQ22_01971 [Pseudomonas duriflava]|uniref:DUF5666 domain-containing protein n=1 Tax=Pseudomonas duriflava TaxID=459528 RepID=A0A562QEC8_9PSED|nr:DUF6152 family protein [Pseudomonas duriflava]TWI55059.1 hypothetical protein IQ22_01971 [Pseudomonas duriflava]
MSYRSRITRTLGLAVLITAALAPLAAAHHGWSWAEAEQIQLNGTVVKVQVAPPHPWLDVKTAEDEVWRVELANPAQTQRAGFIEGSAKPGDTITATGNRSQDASEKRMKAVQIEVNGKTYTLYPERIR